MKTVSMSRIIFDDMVDRGMTSIPTILSENVKLESSVSDLLPTDKDIINLFKKAPNNNGGLDDESLFTTKGMPNSVRENITVLEDYNNGDGNDAIFIIQYTTLKNHKIIIKYIGSYSSWDKTNWYYMGYVPEPKPYIAYYYDVTDIVSI